MTERDKRWKVGGLCVAGLLVLALVTYTGVQMLAGSWALSQSGWMRLFISVFGGGMLLVIAWDFALNAGWRPVLYSFLVVGAIGALAYLAGHYGMNRFMGGVLLAVPALLAVVAYPFWRDAVAPSSRERSADELTRTVAAVAEERHEP